MGNPYTITADAFTSEEDATALASSIGENPIAIDIDAVENDFHWHDFDNTTYVVSGEVTIETPDGHSCTLTSGMSVSANESQLVHREISPGYRAVIGFRCDPSTLTKPIDKPLADRG